MSDDLPLLSPSREEFQRLAKGSNLIPVRLDLHEDRLTTVSAYLSLVGDSNGFLLESVEGGEKVGRYSFIGLDPEKIIESDGGDPLTLLEKELAKYSAARAPDLPAFSGGAVGFIGYDCVGYFEDRLLRRIAGQSPSGVEMPEAAFMICRKILIFDYLTRRLTILVNVGVEGGAGGADLAYDKAREAIDAIVRRLDAAAASRAPRLAASRGSSAVRSKSGHGGPPDGVASNMTREEYMRIVARAKEYISAGDIFQVVLSQRLSRPITVAPFDVYRALRATNPSPYMYYLKFDRFAVVGSSPEVMVRIHDGEITLRPIAGTRRRGATEAEDRALEQELLADKKELAEHIMLVDLGRNDVGRVAAIDSVRVDQRMMIERYSHVMHIVSNVVGRLRDGRSIYDVIRSAFPAGTVSGAPKIRAMEVIAELEPSRRGAYAGAVGYVGFDGNADTAICLRTIVIADGQAHVQAGGGIVYDSDPAAEYDESLNKAAAALRALEWAEEAAR